MISIRLNKESEEMLKKVAEFEGMSVSEFVRNTINEKLEDLYDISIAEETLYKYENGNKKTLSFEEVFNK